MEDGSTAVEWDDVTTTKTEPGEVHEGKVDAYSFETSEPGTKVVPKINSLTKTGSGAMNNYSSSNKGGTKSPGGSKGGGGSPKSEKAKEHKAKKADKFEELKDRYSTIKAAIDDVGRALEDFSNAEEDAFGAAKLAAMKK